MKKICLSVMVCILFLFNACSFSTSEDRQKSSSDSKTEPIQSSLSSLPIVDKTVKNIYRFAMDGYRVIGEVKGSADMEIYNNVAELYEKSTYIVYGSIEEIGYWDESGTGFTLCDFVIEKSYKGNLEPGDKISVLAAGGYYRLSKFIELHGRERFPDLTEEEIQSSLYKTTVMGAPLVEKGEKYLFFLGQISDEPPFPNGIYAEVGSFMGRFYYKDEDTLTRYTPENEPEFYYDDKTRSIPKQEFPLPELEAEIAACAE